MPDDRALIFIVEAFDQRREYGREDLVLELPSDLAELARLRGDVVEWKQAVEAVRALIDGLVKADLGKKGIAVFGPTYYRVAPARNLKVKAERASEWWEWVEMWGRTRELFNPNDARAGGIKKLAEYWVNKETGEIGDFDDFIQHFYDDLGDGHELAIMPVDKAPQWVQKLSDGTIRRASREKETEDGSGNTTPS